MATSLLRSEILCFIQNNFCCSTKENLLTNVCGFYEAEEVIAPKQTLFQVAEEDAGDHVTLPRCVKRRGDGQQRADVDDMLELWAIIDAVHVKMLSFVVMDLKRLPPTTMTEPDVCALAASVMELRCEMKSLTNQLKVAGVLERKGLQEVRDVGSSINVPAASTQQASDVPQEGKCFIPVVRLLRLKM